jgi:hypothetical protein
MSSAIQTLVLCTELESEARVSLSSTCAANIESYNDPFDECNFDVEPYLMKSKKQKHIKINNYTTK